MQIFETRIIEKIEQKQGVKANATLVSKQSCIQEREMQSCVLETSNFKLRPIFKHKNVNFFSKFT